MNRNSNVILKPSKMTMKELSSYIGETFQFTATCEIFPNFNVIGKVNKVSLNTNGELMIYITNNQGKTIPIGQNMHGLIMKKQ